MEALIIINPTHYAKNVNSIENPAFETGKLRSGTYTRATDDSDTIVYIPEQEQNETHTTEPTIRQRFCEAVEQTRDFLFFNCCRNKDKDRYKAKKKQQSQNKKRNHLSSLDTDKLPLPDYEIFCTEESRKKAQKAVAKLTQNT